MRKQINEKTNEWENEWMRKWFSKKWRMNSLAIHRFAGNNIIRQPISGSCCNSITHRTMYVREIWIWGLPSLPPPRLSSKQLSATPSPFKLTESDSRDPLAEFHRSFRRRECSHRGKKELWRVEPRPHRRNHQRPRPDHSSGDGGRSLRWMDERMIIFNE